MTRKKRTLLGAIGLTLGLVALMLTLLLLGLHAVGTDDACYFELQMKAGVLPEAGVSQDDLRRLDGALAQYLAGRPEALATPSLSAPGEYDLLALPVDGELRPAFNERELAHLEDCAGLFALLRKVCRRLAPWVVLLGVGGAYLLQNRRRARRCAWIAPLVLLLPLGAFSLWAALDFDAAFTLFHRLLFRNDLWLLDPRTDLLIRICPQSMFMAMGLRVALWGAAAVAGVTALALVTTYLWPKSRQSEGSAWNDNRATRRAAAQRPKTFDVGGKR